MVEVLVVSVLLSLFQVLFENLHKLLVIDGRDTAHAVRSQMVSELVHIHANLSELEHEVVLLLDDLLNLLFFFGVLGLDLVVVFHFFQPTATLKLIIVNFI